ncbi:hypothetical protein E4L96_15950 [Massilia arenosa]|uniref:Uncharacterized protein n=1 Tax=Zemynaea arenosa TaxID=2561931 RepID=A0A4Y9S5K5_9BURK|nr:hypothetical protein [Massilia arenosa]TFW16637.1 hypothetical protein E4L96_15950 [Massilia arenosa]
MKYSLAAVALVVAAAIATPGSQGIAPLPPPDLTTTQGFERTCAALRLRLPTGNAQRQAAVICRDVALIQHVATFLRKAREVNYGQRMAPVQVTAHVRAELNHLRTQLGIARQMLGAILLDRDEGLVLVPAQWQVDLDSNGTIEVWEKHFFAIPARRSEAPMSLRPPSDDSDYYQAHYDLSARIRVDRTDIAWALSYHQFVESLVETVLAYTMRTSGHEWDIVLIDPAALLRARQLLLSGLKTSNLVRELALAESDDQDEWIPNPHQRQSVFPLALDEEDYAIWHAVLPEITRLFEGAAVLPGDSEARGLWGSLARVCPDGTGLNVSKIYAQPAPSLTHIEQQVPALGWCDPVGPEHPASGLMPLIREYSSRMDSGRASGMDFLKYLLWVN